MQFSSAISLKRPFIFYFYIIYILQEQQVDRDNRLPARVNITLNISNRDAQEKKELPMRLLVLADFTNTKIKQSLAKQERLAVTLGNYQQVLSYLSPKLQLTIPNHTNPRQEELTVDLSFGAMQDFHPKAIVEQVPILQRLSAMKNLLKELRSNIIDNATFKRKIQELLRDPRNFSDVQQELSGMQS